MFEHFYSALFLVIREQYFLLVSLSRLKERNVTTIVEVFEQQLLTYCLLKYLGCQSVSLCICLVCLSIYLCDYVCLHVFLLFFCLGSVMAVYLSLFLFFMSPVFLCALYGLYVSIFVIISICVFLLGCL